MQAHLTIVSNNSAETLSRNTEKTANKTGKIENSEIIVESEQGSTYLGYRTSSGDINKNLSEKEYCVNTRYIAEAEQQCLIFKYIKELAKIDDLYVTTLSIRMPRVPPFISGSRPVEICHLNYYGSELTDQIGQGRLRTAPAFEVTEINDGCALRPFENYQDHATSDRERLEDHLDMKCNPER